MIFLGEYSMYVSASNLLCLFEYDLLWDLAVINCVFLPVIFFVFFRLDLLSVSGCYLLSVSASDLLSVSAVIF